MTKKKEPQYVGRYGEVLEGVEEDKCLLVNGKWESASTPEILNLRGWGIDKDGIKRRVRFSVSRKTGKKCGWYNIYRSKEELEESRGDHPLMEKCKYLNDLPHGSDIFYDPYGFVIDTIRFLRGRQLKGKDSFRIYSGFKVGFDGGEVRFVDEEGKRDDIAEKSQNLRELFSDVSVKEAIKTGSLVKVKTAMTRALKKKEMGE